MSAKVGARRIDWTTKGCTLAFCGTKQMARKARRQLCELPTNRKAAGSSPTGRPQKPRKSQAFPLLGALVLPRLLRLVVI